MNNYHLLYSTKVGSDLDSEEHSEDERSEFEEDEINIKNKFKYETKLYHLFFSSLHRAWQSNTTGTFNFQVRLNPSCNSSGNNTEYYGSGSVGIPIEIKNIESIHIRKLIIPNRKNYLGNGILNQTINLNTILLHIDEFSKTNYGSNQAITNSFSVLSSTNIDNNLNFIEYDNLNESGKIFKPVPLNTINSLTLHFTDLQGNELKYLNEYLEIKTISVDSNTNFIKFTTQKYFSRDNYQEGDILCFDAMHSDDANHTTLLNFLQDKAGHNLFFKGTSDANSTAIETLYNTFYIAKKGEYNLSNGNFVLDSGVSYSNLGSSNISGKMINKNLQLLVKMEIECRENDTSFFNPEII